MNAKIRPENENAAINGRRSHRRVRQKKVGELADPAVESIDRDLAMRGTGRASARRVVHLAGAGFPMRQRAIELAWEALKETDTRRAFKEDERLDGESVSEAKAWAGYAATGGCTNLFVDFLRTQ